MLFTWKKVLTILTLSFSLNIEGRNAFLFHLVKDYLELLNLKALVLFTCDNTQVSDFVLQDKRFVTDLDWISIYDLSKRTLNDDDLQVLLKVDTIKRAVIYDISCPKTEKFFEVISRNSFFNATFNWLIFGTTVPQDKVILQEQKIDVDAEISLLIPDGINSSSRFLIYDIYNTLPHRGGKMNITYKGSWDKRLKFQLKFWQNKNAQRNNFHGIEVKGGIAILKVPKYWTFREYLESNLYPEHDTINRYSFHLYKNIMDKYNFSLYVVRSHSWGNEGPNQTWYIINIPFQDDTIDIFINTSSRDGQFGLLQRKEVDVGITPGRFEPNRIGICDHVAVHLRAIHAILLRHPKNSGLRNLFLRPFENSVWTVTFILLVFVAIVMFVTFSIENFLFFEKKLQIFIDTQTISLFHSIFLSLAFLFQQGFDGPISLMSSKIIIMSLLLFSILLYQYYSAFIVGSLLTVPPRNIRTAQDLIDSNLDAGAENIAYTMDYFQRNYTKYSAALYWKKMHGKPNDNFFPIEEGVKLIKRGGFAFYMDMASGYKIVADTFNEDEVCDLQLIHLHVLRHASCRLPKGSPLNELIRYMFRRMIETGITSHEEPRWQLPKPPCVKESVDVAKVDLKTINSIIITLILGMLLSFFLLIMEVGYFKMKKMLESKNISQDDDDIQYQQYEYLD